MKLIVSELRGWKTYVSREFYHVMSDLIADYGWRHIETFKFWKGPGTVKDTLLREFGELPEVILFWETYNFLAAHVPDVLRLNCHKCILADDLHWWGDTEAGRKKFLCYAMCDTILSTYAYIFDKFHPRLSGIKRIEWVPHSASPDFMLPYNDHPENAILVSGSIDNENPLRQRMKRWHELRPDAIAYHPHPGYHRDYDYDKNSNVGCGYAAKINRYRAGFTDGTVYKYVVAKYFEIPATGALLMADDAVSGWLEKLGLIANRHYLPVSNDDLEEKVQYVLDERNHEGLDEIRRRGQELIRERHQASDRAGLIDMICAA